VIPTVEGEAEAAKSLILSDHYFLDDPAQATMRRRRRRRKRSLKKKRSLKRKRKKKELAAVHSNLNSRAQSGAS
jgi:hypothetical protein